ncbi:proline-rich protein 18 [Xenopus laevis]|uniref:Uncharacterized protein n=2 Tax=Xenopus laevis TaxID=8355 RepID=A0A974HJ88_XENLA|nr:proline-rich protein 18 [Xenopus laevis]OCT80044.1 hypothetical protein XELAEV_18026863mg [Xenopus laevis]
MPLPPIQHQQHTLSAWLPVRNNSCRGAAQSQFPEQWRASVGTEELSNSWPSATLNQQLERRHRVLHSDGSMQPVRQVLEQVPFSITRSYDSVVHPQSSTTSKNMLPCPGKEKQLTRQTRQLQLNSAPPHCPDVRFTLTLTPEALLVLQKKNLEKQQQHKMQLNSRPIFASHSRNQGYPTLSCTSQKPVPDVREILKISLLNEHHRYDDVEYEDDDEWFRGGDVVPGYCLDEGLVRRCTEWLQGVEMATARDKNLNEKLQTLPHLNTY